MVTAATTGVSNDEQGLASGLFNTTQQVGSGLVLAVVVALDAARTLTVIQQGEKAASVATTAGRQYALFACAAVALLALLAVLLTIPGNKNTAHSNKVPAAENVPEEHSSSSQLTLAGRGDEVRR
jgi:sugar phosphate permease